MLVECRKQGLRETITHFAVGIGQPVKTESRVIPLYCQVATLIKYRNRVDNVVGRRIELFIGSRKSVQALHVEIRALQYIRKVGVPVENQKFLYSFASKALNKLNGL